MLEYLEFLEILDALERVRRGKRRVEKDTKKWCTREDLNLHAFESIRT